MPIGRQFRASGSDSIDEQLLTSFRMSRKESELQPISGDSRIVLLFCRTARNCFSFRLGLRSAGKVPVIFSSGASKTGENNTRVQFCCRDRRGARLRSTTAAAGVAARTAGS